MRARNSCNPQLGQRRLAIGGNGEGSGRFGSGMVHPHLLQAGGLLVASAPTPVGRGSVGDVGI